MRLRNPSPAQPAPFTTGDRANRWLIPLVLVLAGLIVLIVLLVGLS